MGEKAGDKEANGWWRVVNGHFSCPLQWRMIVPGGLFLSEHTFMFLEDAVYEIYCLGLQQNIQSVSFSMNLSNFSVYPRSHVSTAPRVVCQWL